MSELRIVKCLAIAAKSLALAAAILAATPALAFIPAGHDPHTIAFFPFTGYENGTRWTVPEGTETTTYATKGYTPDTSSLTNNVAGLDCTVSMSIRSTGYVTVSNDVPGRYLFANKSAKWPISSDFMSIRAVKANSQNTTVSLPNLGKLTAQKANETRAFTFELFVKPNEDCYGNAFYFAIDGNNTTVAIPQNATNIKKFYVAYKLNGTSTTVAKDYAYDLRDSKWHHVAIVYSQPNAEVNGTASFYYDYELAGSLEMVRDSTKNGSFVLGSSVTWSGLFSAVRVSDAALTTDEMMRASDNVRGVRDDSDTIGFYPLNEKAAGFVFDAANCDDGTATTASTYWSGAFSNAAESVGYNCSTNAIRLRVSRADGLEMNPAFYSTNDVPARYVFDGVDATTPICELEASLCELGKEMSGNTGDSIGLQGLPKDFYDAEAFTFEFFAKFLSFPSGTIAYFDLGSYQSNQILFQRQSNEKGFQTVFKQQATTTTGVATYPDLETIVDGKWHHVAIVGDGAKLRLF